MGLTSNNSSVEDARHSGSAPFHRYKSTFLSQRRLVFGEKKQRSRRRVHKSPVEGTLAATSHMRGGSQQQVSDLRGVARRERQKCFTAGTEKRCETFLMKPHFPLKKKSGRGELSLHSPFPFLVLLKGEVHVSGKH